MMILHTKVLWEEYGTEKCYMDTPEGHYAEVKDWVQLQIDNRLQELNDLVKTTGLTVLLAELRMLNEMRKQFK